MMAQIVVNPTTIRSWPWRPHTYFYWILKTLYQSKLAYSL